MDEPFFHAEPTLVTPCSSACAASSHPRNHAPRLLRTLRPRFPSTMVPSRSSSTRRPEIGLGASVAAPHRQSPAPTFPVHGGQTPPPCSSTTEEVDVPLSSKYTAVNTQKAVAGKSADGEITYHGRIDLDERLNTIAADLLVTFTFDNEYFQEYRLSIPTKLRRIWPPASPCCCT